MKNSGAKRLSRKTTNQREDDELSYLKKTAAIKTLNITKPVDSCIIF
jgi:hypothetical protein